MSGSASERPPGSPVLGCIADDFTGATDLANNLVRAGMRVVLTVDVPPDDERVDADAVVVALKSRTVAASVAVEQSLHACRWLRKQGVGQVYFKICSTFDSTAAGNIGPVIEALMDELDCGFSIATPAFPENGRTVVHGHLFVGDTLLSESGMRHHPLTPMTDANLVRVLQAQLNPGKGRKVGLVDYRTVAQSAEAIRKRMDELQAEGIAIAIVDALSKEDLDRLGEALRDSLFLTASSGLGDSLPRNWGFTPSTACEPAAGAGAKGNPRGQLLGRHQCPGAALYSRGRRGLRIGSAPACGRYRVRNRPGAGVGRCVLAQRSRAAVAGLLDCGACRGCGGARPTGSRPVGRNCRAGHVGPGERVRPTRRGKPGGRRGRNSGHLRASSRDPANADWPPDRSRSALVLRRIFRSHGWRPPHRFKIG